jgi:hypothetical protein
LLLGLKEASTQFAPQEPIAPQVSNNHEVAITATLLSTPGPNCELDDDSQVMFISTIVKMEHFRHDDNHVLASFWSPDNEAIPVMYCEPPFAIGSYKNVTSVSELCM